MEITNIHFKHILYASDFSDNAKCASSYAKSITDQYKADITLLHVIKDEIPDLLIFDAGMERASSGVSDRLSLQRKISEEQRDQIRLKIEEEYASKIGIKRVLVEKGNPANVIIKVAENEKCDLIVMGFKGKSTFEDFLMGDTIRHVMSKVKIPVLVVQNKNKK